MTHAGCVTRLARAMLPRDGLGRARKLRLACRPSRFSAPERGGVVLTGVRERARRYGEGVHETPKSGHRTIALRLESASRSSRETLRAPHDGRAQEKPDVPLAPFSPVRLSAADSRGHAPTVRIGARMHADDAIQRGRRDAGTNAALCRASCRGCFRCAGRATPQMSRRVHVASVTLADVTDGNPSDLSPIINYSSLS